MQWFHILMKDVIVFILKMSRLAVLVRNVVACTQKEDAMLPYLDRGCDCFHAEDQVRARRNVWYARICQVRA
jgi:hypothetical protein